MTIESMSYDFWSQDMEVMNSFLDQKTSWKLGCYCYGQMDSLFASGILDEKPNGSEYGSKPHSWREMLCVCKWRVR